MHSPIYPTQDTYISNQKDILYKNFGIDEILEVGKNNQSYINLLSYVIESIPEFSGSINLSNYTGTFVGYISGTDSYISGSVSDCSTTPAENTGC